jgi:hypothetical protein
VALTNTTNNTNNKYYNYIYVIIKENAENLLAASKEIGLEVNADKTKYMVMSRDQTAGQSHSMKVRNSSFERWKSSNN